VKPTKVDQLVGSNVRKIRTFRGAQQVTIAARMVPSHPQWTRQTVGEVERGNRSVTVGELVDLASILDVTATLLLAEELDVTAVL
jgi:transcriptional regulator with XRE-family HTH domain